MSLLLEGTASEQAGLLLNQGWSQLVTWQGQWVAHVPCHNMLETTYRVNLITMECECPVATYMGPCLHLCLVIALAQLRNGPTPEEERHKLASEAYENSDYIMDHVSCITFHNGILCVTKLENWKCICIASAFDVDCVGKILLKIAEGAEEAVTYTIPASVATPSPCVLSSPGSLTKNTNESPINSGKPEAIPSFTITVSSKTEKDNLTERSLHVIQEQPIIIQTHTGIETKSTNLSQMISPRVSETTVNNMETIKVIKAEINDQSEESDYSSQAIIEKLYHWSKSKEYADSDVLNDLLKETYDLLWGKQGSSFPKQLDSKDNKINVLGNKKLRAVVRSVKRPRNHAEDGEQELNKMSSVIPSAKVSRSGRTIKVKEEPDFVM